MEQAENSQDEYKTISKREAAYLLCVSQKLLRTELTTMATQVEFVFSDLNACREAVVGLRSRNEVVEPVRFCECMEMVNRLIWDKKAAIRTGAGNEKTATGS